MHKFTKRTFSVLLIFLCLPILSKASNCDGEGWKAIEGVEKGDIQPLKTYLENGGDPLYFCSKPYNSGGHNGSGYIEVHLSDVVMRSESYEIVSYYLSYTIPQHLRNQMLLFYAVPDAKKDSQRLLKLLIQSGAHAYSDCITENGLRTLKNLKKQGYDFSYVSSSGNNLLMEYAICTEPRSAKKLIRMMKYLIKQGCATNLTNMEGKTLKDLSTNEKIRKFTASL